MILGLDPGIRKIGFSIIDNKTNIIDSGIIILEQDKFERKNQYTRMKEILDFFDKLTDKYIIKKLCIEKYFITSFNKKNAEFIYGVRALLIILAIQKNIEFEEYAPLEIKKIITGNGKANKQTVQKFIQKIFNLKDKPQYDDASDSLGLAYIGYCYNKK